MNLLDKLKVWEKELNYLFFRIYLKDLIKNSYRMIRKRDLDEVVRPYIFSFIFNRGVGLTTSLVRLSEEGKLRKFDHTVYIHNHYSSSFDILSENVICYTDREDLYERLSVCNSKVALIDVYNLNQEEFRQYISNNYNKKNRMILTFSTHGFV